MSKEAGKVLLMDGDEFAFKAALKAERGFYLPVEESKLDEQVDIPASQIEKSGYSSKYDCAVYGIGDKQGLVPKKFILLKNIQVCYNFLDRLVEERLTHPEIGKVVFCYSSGGNFRYKTAKINPYKGNRKSEKPAYFQGCMAYILEKYESIVKQGMETDDILGMEHTKPENKQKRLTIIDSQDKDLRTIPGEYLSNRELINIEPLEATRWLYTQILMGDSVDNVYTIPGMGKVKAGKILKDCTTEVEMFNNVYKEYEKAMKAPLAKRKYRAENRGVLPSIQDRSVESVLGEIGELVFILRSDRMNWWPDNPQIDRMMNGLG